MEYVESLPLKTVDWRHNALCRDTDPETFFPVGKKGPALRDIENARAVCRDCKAIGYCALFALETGEDTGVWGGLSEDERRALRGKAKKGQLSLIGFAQNLQDMYAETHPNATVLPDLIPHSPPPDPGESNHLPEAEQDVA